MVVLMSDKLVKWNCKERDSEWRLMGCIESMHKIELFGLGNWSSIVSTQGFSKFISYMCMSFQVLKTNVWVWGFILFGGL
jgi:hypothetical protein